jgi:rhamnulokinase
MGLWLLSESLRFWERSGEDEVELGRLLAQAAEIEGPVSVFDANDSRFMAPGEIPDRIADYCREHDQPEPGNLPEYVRSILESLAAAFAAAVEKASELSGRDVHRVHVVGGRSQNELLCQLIADLEVLRAVVAESGESRRYEPRPQRP